MKKLGGQCIHGVIHGRECLRCEYEADLAVNPRAWEWWEVLLPKHGWIACNEYRKPFRLKAKYHRSPDAPDRDEWYEERCKNESNRLAGISPQPDKCANYPNCKALDVLCYIHKDGGHYIEQHGVEKAAEDAIDKVIKLFQQPDKCAICPHHPDNLPEPMREEPEKKLTARNFDYYEFTDLYGAQYSIQKSSLAFTDAIWFGIDDADPKIMASKTKAGGNGWVKYDIPEDVLLNTRMHLSREQVSKLLPILQRFVEHGDI